jgi:N-sulfoglucosamine sulfohydrolase
MNLRSVLSSVLTALLVALGVEAAPGAQAAAGKRPNLVLIVADDMGLTLGAYGDKNAKTPHLDRLAAEGTRFTHAFCTTASCSPSRSVILTGLHNHASGQYGLQHAAHHFETFSTVRSLPVLLREAGYRTARIGKFHVGPESVYQFEEVITGDGGGRNPMAMAERTRTFLEAKSDRPFFLYFCTADPHRSGEAGKKEPLAPDRFGNAGSHQGVEEVRYEPGQLVVPPFLPDTPACRAELAEYYQSVSRVDQGVGRLLKLIEETGQGNDTVVMFLSDNGIPFPGAKTTQYEPGIRLPLIVRAPGHPKGGIVSRAMVSWTDIAPTLLDFAGMDPPTQPAMHGRSFRAAIETVDLAGWDEVYGSHTFHEVTMYYPMRVVRTRRHKLIQNIAHPLSYPFASDLHGSATWQGVLKDGLSTYGRRSVKDFLARPRWELYDLEADPDEIKNLAEDPQSRDTLAALKAKLKAFQERTKDPWLVKYAHE